MKFQIVPVTLYQQNCSVVWCEETLVGAVIDPGGDLDRIKRVVTTNGIKLEKILLTHGHMDHVGGTGQLANEYGLPIEGPHKSDLFWLDSLPQQAQMMGIATGDSFVPDRWLQQGDEVQFGNITMSVHHCPGHTPGHVVFFHAPSKTAFVGDVLFQGSIGRTDFPQGDHETLITSIKERLWPLGDNVEFVPGHGPMSTFGAERRTNPFVADKNYG